MSLARPSPRSLAAAVLTVAAALPVTLTAPAAQPAQAAIGGLTWSDEFTGAAGTAPNSSKWVLETGGGGWGNNELQYYTNNNNASMNGNGQLVIEARREAVGGMQYTSHRMNTGTKFAFEYGRVAARN